MRIRYLNSIIIIQTMQKSNHSLQNVLFQLRHMELQPQKIQTSQNIQISIKIHKNNSNSFGENRACTQRKFIFILEETEEETTPLSEGDEYCFQQQLNEVGTYHLQCLNYPKIKSKIQIIGKPYKEVIDLTEPLITQTSTIQLEKLTEVQQQKEQELKEMLQNNFQNSYSKSDYAEYERILNDEEIQYDYMPNKYLKYFKEEFKLWRDFFDKQPEKPQKDYASQPKEKVNSGSLSFSERESEKEQSVISHLRSQQEVSEFQEQQLKNPKIMKKTNSESCYVYVVDRQISKTHLSSNIKRRPLNTNTSSPHQNVQQFEADSFIDWAYNWSVEQGYSQINLKKKNDSHLVSQWLTFLHNKFKISQFIYG